MARRGTFVAVWACAVLVVADGAQAQYFGRNKVHYDRLEFQRLQTEHFDVYYYEEEEEATRQAARMAERWYFRYSALLDHTLRDRQPLILYASHPHFSQTNLTPGHISEGTGGFTESVKSRIAMPFAAGLGETDHVLGHEIAHAFQIAVVRSAGQNAFALPLWFIEGMAEYMSVGPAGAHTGMWMRDAILHELLPDIGQIDDPRYSPYRYGHAFWSYLCGRFGDGVLARVLRAKGSAIDRIEKVTGIDVERLSKEWRESIVVPEPDGAAGAAPALPGEGGRIHVGPALSPDGRRVMFLSERDRLSLDLFMADVATGEILQKILSTAADPHFDSLQYLQSAGAWDPSGRYFALTALSGGDAVLVIVDTEHPSTRREIEFGDVHEVYSPSWSPDGERLVFSGLKNGLSDLFVYTLATGTVQQLTRDAFADLHPAWSPDGRTIAFATDRFTTTLPDLRFGALRIGLIDVESGLTRELFRDAGRVKQISPQWSPDGGAIYFVSDRDGTSNVYRVERASGAIRQLTDVVTGVSGVTGTSPALAIASRAGSLAMSVYSAGRYEIQTMAAADAADAGRIEAGAPAPAAAAPADDGTPSIAQMLRDPVGGLPAGSEFTTGPYDDRLRLESIAHPYIGAGAGGAFGGVVRGGFGLTFGDVLKDRQLQMSITAGTRLDDFAAQVTYLNRQDQWNWGVAAGFQPARFYGARAAIDTADGLVTRETSSLRYIHQWGGLAGRYNIDRARRIEVRAGLRRTGFTWQTITRVVDQAEGRVLSRERTEEPAGDPIFLAETQAAFVHDTSVWGPLGPLLGQRLRFEVEPAFGPLVFADIRADARRYFMPLRPLTFAARLQHVGRYGPDAADPRLTPLVAGLQTLVRGYDLRTFAADRCGRSAQSCSVVDELTGSRFALINLEVRAPLPGLFTGRLEYPGLVPVEALAFVDAGYLWTRSPDGVERDPFRSAGAGARVNLGGVVFEITAARPFDQAQGGWRTSLLIRPGW